MPCIGHSYEHMVRMCFRHSVVVWQCLQHEYIELHTLSLQGVLQAVIRSVMALHRIVIKV